MKYEIYGTTVEIDESLVDAGEAEIRERLDRYMEGEKSLDIKVSFPDNFTGEVMKEMQKIPYSQTRTYGEIAEEIDSSAIAVGSACSRNPVPVIVPCHRIVASDGIGGYQYPGLKQKLLELEKRT